MITLYYILSTCIGLLVLPGLTVLSTLTGRKRHGLWHHFGMLPRGPRPHRPTLWLHALSVGEVNAAVPLLNEIHSCKPDIYIVVTVTTEGGYQTATEKLSFVDTVAFHPIDAWPFVSLAVQRIRPDLFVLVDTGFWPGLIFKLREKGVPAILLNGRISERSFKNYLKVPSFMREVFQGFTQLYMQTPEGVARAYDLGASEDAIALQADTKYDQLHTTNEEDRRALRESLKLSPHGKLLIAGSTHAGEEEIILEAFQQLREKFPNLTLILAPRRLERLAEVESLLNTRAIPYQRKSRLREPMSPVILLDTMGELAGLYSVADVAFVGRSLIDPGGGHSLAEAAIQGVPVLHGPFIENVKAQAGLLRPSGSSIEVNDAHDLVREINNLLEDDTRRGVLGEQARILVEGQKGASKEFAEIFIGQL